MKSIFLATLLLLFSSANLYGDEHRAIVFPPQAKPDVVTKYSSTSTSEMSSPLPTTTTPSPLWYFLAYGRYLPGSVIGVAQVGPFKIKEMCLIARQAVESTIGATDCFPDDQFR